jgi:ribonucleoside-diphosphate reductase alpha chain
MNANAFTHRSRVGSHLIKNKILENLLDKYEQNTDEVWKTIILDGGSVRTLDFLTEHEKDVFKTFKEINPMDIILLASDRQKYLCQGQSINLYFPPKCDKKILNEVHYKAWEKGCKGLYYLRTESSNKVDKLSEKVERNSLKDYKEATDNECKACEG